MSEEGIRHFDAQHGVICSSDLVKKIAEGLPYASLELDAPTFPSDFIDIEKTENALRELVGASDTEYDLIFTSSIEESLATTFFSAHKESHQTGKNHWLSTNLGTADILMGFDHYKTLGMSTDLALSNSAGLVTPSILELFVNPRTSYMFLPWVDRQTGVLQPIDQIVSFANKKDIRLFVDGTDCLGKVYFSLKDYPIDYFALDFGRIGGPPSLGCLFVKKGAFFAPLMPSGLSKRGRNNLASLRALDDFISVLAKSRAFFSLEMPRLCHLFEKGISRGKVLFSESDRLAHIVVMQFEGIHQESMLYHLKQKGLLASIGGGSMQTLDEILKKMWSSKCRFEICY